MSKNLQQYDSNTQPRKKFFELKQGSNYMITTTYKEEYVVEFDQFLNIAESLQKTNIDFVTINQTILNKSKIYKIEPTHLRTEAEKNIKLDPSFGM